MNITIDFLKDFTLLTIILRYFISKLMKFNGWKKKKTMKLNRTSSKALVIEIELFKFTKFPTVFPQLELSVPIPIFITNTF